MLNTAVLSDLHFGEPYNLVHDQGVPVVLNLLKVHAAGHLRRLVLCGDIFEMSTPESMDLVRSQARFFLREARSRFQIDEVIWVPGNHDYALFRRFFPSAPATAPGGDPAPQALVDEFFGVPMPVRVAYPHLLLQERQPAAGAPRRRFVLHHGHYFDDLVLGRGRSARLSAWFSALAGGHLISPREIPLDGSQSLADVEVAVRPVLDGIWGFHPDPGNLQNECWELLRRYQGYTGCVFQPPDLVVSDTHEGHLLADEDVAKAGMYVRALRRDPAYRAGVAGPEALTLVYGHTHQGGERLAVIDGVPVRLVNLGGWVASAAPTRRGELPHTHLFLINDDLQTRTLTAAWPAEWAQRCLDHGSTVFAIPGVDDEFVRRVQEAPPAAGMSVAELLLWQQQRPFGQTQAQADPFTG